jgi:hypothetical protein
MAQRWNMTDDRTIRPTPRDGAMIRQVTDAAPVRSAGTGRRNSGPPLAASWHRRKKPLRSPLRGLFARRSQKARERERAQAARSVQPPGILRERV